MNTSRWVLLFFWSFVIVLCPSSLHSQAWGEELGARIAGMNNTSVALPDFWNLHNNPAGIACLSVPAIGINYASRFSLKELSTKSLAMVYPVQKSVLGVTVDYFGYALYHEVKAGLVYSRKLGKRLSVGTQLDYLSVAFGEGYANRHRFTFGLGVQYAVTDELRLGASVYNPVGIRYDTLQSLVIPAVFRAGLAYSFSDQLLTTAELEKSSLLGYWNVRAGVEFRPNERFAFRAGTGFYREVFSFGMGYAWKNLKFDIASTVHQQLGLTSQFSILYTFRK
ncbi:MAG: hypothetical protein JXR71_04725 [Bacteroidales bacterium]|nr:hypothetical protein [Bacteroidales bacterium]